jgi:hypothetical protein
MGAQRKEIFEEQQKGDEQKMGYYRYTIVSQVKNESFIGRERLQNDQQSHNDRKVREHPFLGGKGEEKIICQEPQQKTEG